MKNNNTKTANNETRNGVKRFDKNQFHDSLEFCFLPSTGQTKKINPIENKSLIIDKLINFLKAE